MLRIAYNERARLADEAERHRREVQRQLAEEERRRRETQQRLDQHIKSSWEQVEAQVAEYEKESRLRAAGLLTAAEREAKVLKERAEAEVRELFKVRGEVLSGLNEIQARIETAVRRDKISVVKSPPTDDEVGGA